jgi:prepilin-type processing-associated H-X9-DG protein
LVVIAIVGVLVALLMPAIQASREAARRTQCSENLHQIGEGLLSYHAARRNFPVGCIDCGARRLAWSLFLLPFIEESATYELYDQQVAYSAAPNRLAAGAIVSIYLCPRTARLTRARDGNTSGDGNGSYDPGDFMAMADYGGMFGWANASTYANGVMLYDQPVSLRQITDGSAHTILVAEDSGRGTTMDGAWADGENIFDSSGTVNALQNNEIWSDHSNGAQVAMCDGSVRFLVEGIDASVLGALCTRAGGEVNDAPP